MKTKFEQTYDGIVKATVVYRITTDAYSSKQASEEIREYILDKFTDDFDIVETNIQSIEVERVED